MKLRSFRLRAPRPAAAPLLAALAFAAVLGCSKSDAASTTSVTVDGKRQVAIVADDKGFSPSSVQVKKGEATTLMFKRTSDDTCARQVVFPELKITKELPLNQAVAVEVPVGDARTLTFQCGMAMFKGKVVID